jgi:dihydroorotate dehydrogenase
LYSLLRGLLFLLPAERAHHFTMSMMRILFSVPGASKIFETFFKTKTPQSAIRLWGLNFPNRVGLAAGFDKDALLGHRWSNLGFGFIEVGTVTPKPQPGNDQPRLFRLKKDQAIQNRMGFNNEGVEAMVERIRQQHPRLIIGGNIGKNKNTSNEHAADDYIICFRALHLFVDFFTVNVSSPNTPGLRELQEKEPLKKLLKSIMEERKKLECEKPVLLKIAPDLNHEQLDDIIEIVFETGIHGLIATNTTLDRSVLKHDAALAEKNGAGGISGKPLKEKSTAVIRYLYQKSGGKIPLIGVGGIHSAEDALEKIKAGASLVQLYSGFIYEGPALTKKINQELEKYFNNVK